MSAEPLVVASANTGKRVEMRAILAKRGIAVIGLDEAGAVVFPEEGDDYEANAIAKARAAAEQLGRPALADDSGLEVSGLGGAPGPRSARYGGPDLDAAGRIDHLLEQMAGLAGEERAARFVCVAAVARPGGEVFTATGTCRGRILRARRGRGGFGYDPVFEVEDRGVAMAELSAEIKNELSHRAQAVLALADAGHLDNAQV